MITLSADIPQTIPFAPVSPVTMPTAWNYAIPDALAESTPPTDIAEFEFPARAGQVGSVNVNVSVPSGRPGLTLCPYIETDTERWVLAETVATTAGVAISTDFPAFAEGTTEARLGFELREPSAAAASVLGTNRFTNPRCAATTNLGTRYSWTLSTQTAGSDLPMQAGLRTYGQVQATSSTTGSGRGINLYQSTDGSTPTAGVGFSASGLNNQTVTISAYVYSTKAATVQASARSFAGTTWRGTTATGTATAIAANTWTRLSVTLLVDNLAGYFCATFMTTDSVSWVSGDQFRVSAVMIEKTATLHDYYDGETADTATEGFRWSGTANASTSEKYSLTGGYMTPGRSLVISGLTMAVQAEAEEITGAALTRPLRRSVYDALNEPAPQIAVGTPGLLAGSITYLCDSLESALALDGIYQYAGLVTLTTGEAMDGFKHMAVEQLRLNAERAVPGKPSKWLVQAEVRELE